MTCLPLRVAIFLHVTHAAIEGASGIWQCPHNDVASIHRRGWEMLPKTMLALVLGAVAVTSVAIPASGAETGMAAMHSMRREGGKLCMSDHWHYGSSGAQPSKAAAQRAQPFLRLQASGP